MLWELDGLSSLRPCHSPPPNSPHLACQCPHLCQESPKGPNGPAHLVAPEDRQRLSHRLSVGQYEVQHAVSIEVGHHAPCSKRSRLGRGRWGGFQQRPGRSGSGWAGSPWLWGSGAHHPLQEVIAFIFSACSPLSAAVFANLEFPHVCLL